MIARIKAEWRLKVALLVIANAVFWGGYQILGRHAFFSPREVPLTWLDRAVDYQPDGWVWVYLSQYVFTSALPLLLTTREALWRYARTLALMSGGAFVVFLFFPTPGPRPLEVGGNIAMQFLATADAPMNALPSLHAAFIACMTALAWRMFRSSGTLAVSAVWGPAILFSTLATKQHYALDLLAGLLLGAVADWLAWRGASAAAMMPVSDGVMSQRGAR